MPCIVQRSFVEPPGMLRLEGRLKVRAFFAGIVIARIKADYDPTLLAVLPSA